MQSNNELIVMITVVSIIVATFYVYFFYRRYYYWSKDRLAFQKSSLSKSLPILIAAASALLPLFYFAFRDGDATIFRTKDDVLTERISRLELESVILARQAANMDSLMSQVRLNTSSRPVTSTEMVTQVSVLRRDVNSTKSAIHHFEQLLLSDPERLISLPLLKKDLESNQKEIASIKEQVGNQIRLVEETQTQGRWIVGTLGIGILALIVPIAKTAFSQTKDSKKKKK